MFDQKIREVKGRDFTGFGIGVKAVGAFKEGVAMGAGDHLDPQFGAALLELPARAAIGVDHVDLIVDRAVLCDGGLHMGDDLVRIKMKFRRQAGQIDVIELIGARDRQDFTRQSATGDQKDAASFALSFWGGEAVFGQALCVERFALWQRQSGPL
ncbi:MAG: hypothetical protein EpisKO_13950 [Epibacterium sp.]